MDAELAATTEAGRRFVDLAEEHAADFATRAAEHDRDGSFPVENFKLMQESGLLAGCVPARFGGLGVESLHDLMVGMNRLGRGCASTAIATCMHFGGTWLILRLWRDAEARASAGRRRPHMGAKGTGAVAVLLEQIGAGRTIVCAVTSEAGTDMAHPLCEARRTEGGWLLRGRKTFGTLTPVADLIGIGVRVKEQTGDRWGIAFPHRSADGLTIADNWDALGMRASGSHDVILEDVFVPEPMLRSMSPWGAWSVQALELLGAGAVFLSGTFIGIAEQARELAYRGITTQRRAPGDRLLAERPAIQRTFAEIEIELAASRAVLSRCCLRSDESLGRRPLGTVTLGEIHTMMKEFQCAKTYVNRAAIEVVDRALTVSGGAGYLSSNPLSRLYRDVRAGPFMQIYSPNEAFEYIGKVSLGLDPSLDM